MACLMVVHVLSIIFDGCCAGRTVFVFFVLSTTYQILTRRSGRATWFLSWVWGYKFSTVSEALKRWWTRHERVSRDSSGDVYIWWCVMVINQLLGCFGKSVFFKKKHL